jgi:hypothetical protein
MIRFDPYAVVPPRDTLWDYVVDDEPIRPAAPGSLRLLVAEHGAVRLGPDCAFRVWRNEHVLVHEEGSSPLVLHVRATLYFRPRPSGADVIDFEARIEDPDGERRATIIIPSFHLRRARHKLLKVLDWYRSERRRRDAGETPMLTAFELWTGGEKRATAS